ncbi:MAG: pentapeptide repeat-containing protein [Caulobacterales bacterium]|nr:pentapeptide repeat-containing protein [Caulobacterales bacterium]
MDTQNLKTLSQIEFDEALIAHGNYLTGRMGAKRLVLHYYDFSNVNLRGCDLRDADFTGCKFNEADFSFANLKSASFYCADLRKANLRDANLSRADLRGTLFHEADLTNADLSQADMREGAVAQKNESGGLTQFLHNAEEKKSISRFGASNGANYIKASGADFSYAKLRDANFCRAQMKQTIMKCADLANTNLTGANLEGADLEGANMVGTNTEGANLRGANLYNVLRAPVLLNENKELLLIKELENHIEWRETHGISGIPANLENQDLRIDFDLAYKKLTALRAKSSIWFGLKFFRTELQGANLSEGDLRMCEFVECDLRGIILAGSNLSRSNFKNSNLGTFALKNGRILKADLRDCDLSYANLSGLDLSSIMLDGANLEGANLKDTILPDDFVPMKKRKKYAI